MVLCNEKKRDSKIAGLINYANYQKVYKSYLLKNVTRMKRKVRKYH